MGTLQRSRPRHQRLRIAQPPSDLSERRTPVGTGRIDEPAPGLASNFRRDQAMTRASDFKCGARQVDLGDLGLDLLQTAARARMVRRKFLHSFQMRRGVEVIAGLEGMLCRVKVPHDRLG